jgi:prepilin-type N-terminal cleavage/methylation domain-containing protein
MTGQRSQKLKQKEGCRMRRYGFTLIELLVVIAIIAILAAILFPCVQPGSREGTTGTVSVQHAQCRNGSHAVCPRLRRDLSVYHLLRCTSRSIPSNSDHSSRSSSPLCSQCPSLGLSVWDNNRSAFASRSEPQCTFRLLVLRCLGMGVPSGFLGHPNYHCC